MVTKAWRMIHDGVEQLWKPVIGGRKRDPFVSVTLGSMSIDCSVSLSSLAETRPAVCGLGPK